MMRQGIPRKRCARRWRCPMAYRSPPSTPGTGNRRRPRSTCCRRCPADRVAEPGTEWTEREFTAHDFRDEDLNGLRTERVVFTECDFSGADLGESEHVGTAFRNCTFRRTTLWHSIFRHCSMLGSVFTECRLRPVAFVEADFRLAVLGECDLRGVDLSDCRLSETSLVKTDLRKAVLRRADLRGARTQD